MIGNFYSLSVIFTLVFLYIPSVFAKAPDATILNKMAKLYNYKALHNVKIETNNTTITFSDAKTGKIKIVKKLPIFQDEQTVWIIDSTKMIRKQFVTSEVDTGVVSGLFDVASMISSAKLDTPIIYEKIRDTSYLKISISDFKRMWFLLSLFQPIPVANVNALLLVEEKSLQIREIKVTVYYQSDSPDKLREEPYIIRLSNYRKVKGILIPRDYFATLDTKSTVNDDIKTKVLAVDLENPTYTNYVLQKFQEYVAKAGSPKEKVIVGNKSKEFIFNFRTLNYNIVVEKVKGRDGVNLHVKNINEKHQTKPSEFNFQ